MKNRLRPFYGYFVMLGVLAALVLAGQAISTTRWEAKDDVRVILKAGDDLVKITPQAPRFATVLELKPFKGFSQDLLMARICMNGDNSHISIERPAYVLKSEGISVGERVFAHVFLQENSDGSSEVIILMKEVAAK